MKLDVRGLDKRFSGLNVLVDVSFTAEPSEITAVIGPNGAGKTTLFNCIAGFHAPTAGAVFLDDREITGMLPAQVLRSGLARTFQLVQSFEGLTVLESVMTAGHWRSGQGFLSSIFARPSIQRSERRLRTEALETLSALGIGDLANKHVHTLPYGQQRLVELAKVVMTGAGVLLLDEPAAGLHEQDIDTLRELLVALRLSGRTVLLVEHNMGFVMSVADKIVVLDFGHVIARGTPEEISSNKKVIDSYLGTDVANA